MTQWRMEHIQTIRGFTMSTVRLGQVRDGFHRLFRRNRAYRNKKICRVLDHYCELLGEDTIVYFDKKMREYHAEHLAEKHGMAYGVIKDRLDKFTHWARRINEKGVGRNHQPVED